ncbi:Uncharacterised protein [Salmonella enterica subsp. enterica serovar Bovismorbificans]|uniref:Uncharacterized protein n=1 Tax=Salmonella enterica subsp. enterica serovar Bovismorbificans TaxID=58097 RepID=A0A655DKW4_SALET|nr:Uncharacterised protein [Salmonella enterica subsp. enterica serovar Bovismorbificans]CNU72314.1 Uncharacterised protein [Salmonella enterica subsp. enterica serovar Bovismorbificans]
MHHLFGIFIARFGFLFYVVEVIEHQQSVGQRFGSNRRQFRIVQRINQRMNVVTTLHGAQQFNGFFWGDQRGGGVAFRDSSEKTGFNISGFIYARRNAVDQQV